MNSTWLVELKDPFKGDTFQMTLWDIKEILGELPRYNRGLLDALARTIKIHENYYVYEGLKTVWPPNEEAISPENFILLLATDIDGLSYGILFLLLPAELVVIAVRPLGLRNAIKDIEDIDALLYALVERYDRWRDVTLVL